MYFKKNLNSDFFSEQPEKEFVNWKQKTEVSNKHCKDLFFPQIKIDKEVSKTS